MRLIIAIAFKHVNSLCVYFFDHNCVMTTLAKRLAEERHSAGLSQTALAKKAGCSQTTVADIERGRNSESTKLARIAAALGLHAVWLQRGTGPKHTGGNGSINEDGIYITDPRIIAIVRMLQQEEAPYLVEKIHKDLAADIELMRAATARAKANDC